MLISNSPIVIIIHVVALLLFLAAAMGYGIHRSERRRIWHLGWLALALLMVLSVIADAGWLR